jgi:hypothetical protein
MMTEEFAAFRERLFSNGCKGLAMLVGSSPLPNLMAAVSLKPEYVALICTQETASCVKELITAIEEHYSPMFRKFAGVRYLQLSDAFQPKLIVKSIKDAGESLSDLALFYTGGTKAMSVHVHETWKELCGGRYQAIYLADKGCRLCSDTGEVVTLQGLEQINLKTIARMHGLIDLNFKESLPLPTKQRRLAAS